MSEYTELYNIELNSSSSYAAKFIEKTLEELPSQCKLPPLTTLPTLVPLNITLPSLACKYIIDQAVVPQPYFCTPSLNGSFSTAISSVSYNASLSSYMAVTTASAVGGASLTRVTDSDCDFSLDGGIILYLPDTTISSSSVCIPSITTSASGTGSNSLGAVPIVNVNFTNDFTDLCSPSIIFNVDVEMNVCTDIQYQLEPPGPLVIDILEGEDGLSIGSLSASMDLTWDLENDCAPKLSASWATNPVISLTLSNTDGCSSVSLALNSTLPSASIAGTIYDQSSMSIGSLDIKFALSVGTGSEDDCTPKLFLDWTQTACTATISLPSQSSQSSQSLTTYTLLICEGSSMRSLNVYGPEGQ